MSWNHWVRQIHRWLSIAFTVTVIANFVLLALLLLVSDRARREAVRR